MPSNCTLNEYLSHAAARWGDRLALVDGETALSWAGLEQISSRIASALLDCGARRGDRVALCAPKSARLIASIHGALKLGCVCVPIDPSSPRARAQTIVEDSTAAVIVGSGEKLAQFAGDSSPVQLCIDGAVEGGMSWPEVLRHDVLGSPVRLELYDLAYLLYTSGSTGQPKGVMLSHQNVSAFASWAAVQFALTAKDRVASVAPLHFDLSTFDLYSTAWSGASLHLPSALHLSFPVRLTEWLASEDISIMYTVPSLLAMIAERGDLKSRELENLRLLLFAGEVCPPRLLSQLLDLLPGVEFANLYGPTETNVCTFESIDRKGWDRVSPISLGIPCEGTRVLLVDDDGNAVKRTGVAGELLIAGPTVALGYWRDSAKTDARFVCRDGERWCRTGDYAAFDHGGRLVFHGRRDHMVKIRGHRVELGEIESALLAHAAVAEAAVVVCREALVAYVRATQVGVSGEELREHLAARLPRYMMPAEIKLLDALPHGSTGKIDRMALERMACYG